LEKPILVPYVAPDKPMAEFTLRAVALGVVLSLLFGMVNAYVGLKIGLTVSASIPSAVLSMAVLRGLLRTGTVLENNVTHAVGSTGESVAAGIIFTLPALAFLHISLTPFQIFLLGASSGLLGLLMMIPLRKGLMVDEHATLPFPEGTACAKVLVAGDKGGTTARPVIIGGAIGSGYKLAMSLTTLWRDSVSWTSESLHKATLGFDLSPLMLGVGYLIGFEVSLVMLAGGVLGFVILIPAFDLIAGTGIGAALGVPPEAASWPPVGPEDVHSLWGDCVRYVGAGAVAFGGLVSLAKAIPTIGGSFKGGLAAFGKGGGGSGTMPLLRPLAITAVVFAAATGALLVIPSVVIGGKVPVWEALTFPEALLMAGVFALVVFAALATHASIARSKAPRADRDMPMPLVLGGIAILCLALWLVPQLGFDLPAALVTVIFSFFFVVVSARMVGLIGTTSQPMSGMVITALLACALLFRQMGRTGDGAMAMTILVGAAVAITISMSGDLAQDLKTGALLGATPGYLQIGQMIGTVAAALRAGAVLLLLDAAYGLGSANLPAPQAKLMATIVRGVMEGQLPWKLLLLGAALALVTELVGVSSLAFAIGLYLPVTTSAPLIFGGLISWWVRRKSTDDAVWAKRDEKATLLASGMIAGDALTGIALAVVAVAGLAGSVALRRPGEGILEDLAAIVPFAIAAVFLYRSAMKERAT
jgi:uncharacterized oligopeptide transporter (OPT) family protein